MNDPMTIEAPLQTDADYEAAIDRYLVAIDKTLRQINQTQGETKQLRLENQAALTEIAQRVEKMRARGYD